MIEAIKKLFATKKKTKYSGFSDFFLHAPEDVKKEVITEAARKSNEDQLKIFKKSHLKLEVN